MDRLSVGIVDYEVELAPDGVVHEILIPVGRDIHLEVGAVLEHVEAVEYEVLRTKGASGVGSFSTLHEHVETLEVGAAHEGTVGHSHLEHGLVVDSVAIAVGELDASYILVAPCRLVGHTYGAVVVV